MTPNINKILKADPRSSKYGAPLGDADRFDNGDELLYIQRVAMIDGDYAPDGTYWGGYPSKPLYCAFSDMNRIYVRAMGRKQAMGLIQERYPGVRFIKI